MGTDSSDETKGEITRLLVDWSEGHAGALDQLAPIVYEELRRLAARHLRREPAAQTLQATGLVHEAFIRLVDQKNARWQSRAHFFSLASNLMRRILVDQARARRAAKRGDGVSNVSLDVDQLNATFEAGGAGLLVERHDAAAADKEGADLMSIDAALARLEKLDARQAQIVELRFFGGLTVEETAQSLQISDATVKRDWVMAKAWLARELAAGKTQV
jgi:RNA polymerase sigma factor (sigma-70 family)